MPLTLTTTQFADTQQIDAADFTVPFGEVKSFVDGLETALAADVTNLAELKDGTDILQRLNLGPTTTLTLDTNGYITATQSRHLVDTFSAAAADDLVKINGVLSGGVLIIQSVSAARVVTIKHNVDNIWNTTETDLVLSKPQMFWLGLYDITQTKWIGGLVGGAGLQAKEVINTTPVTLASVTVPDRTLVQSGPNSPRLAYAPSLSVRHRIGVRANGNAILGDLTTLTTVGTISTNNMSDGHYSMLQTPNTSGGVAGVYSPLDIVQLRHNPHIYARFRIGASGPITTGQGAFYIGFTNTAFTSGVAPASSQWLLLFRLFNNTGTSYVAQATSANGTTLTNTTIASPSAADNTHTLSFRYDNAGSTAYYSLDNAAEVSFNTTIPANSNNMGLIIMVRNSTVTWSQIGVMFSRLELAYD